MKTWLTLLWIGLSTIAAFAQGTVLFSTRISPIVDAKIFDVDGVTPLSGSAFKAQIYGGASAQSLSPCGDPLPFRSDAGVGYVDNRSDPAGGVRSINGVRPLQTAYVQVRAWEAAKGSTYEAARDAGGKHGASATITIVCGGDLVVPPNLVGLQGFKLQLSAPPSIVSQPKAVTTGSGGLARFEVTPGGSPPFTYQWKKNNVDIQGARSATYEIASVNNSHLGNYSVRVSNSFGFIDSDAVPLVIAPVPAITEVLINPATPLLGRTMRLEVVVQGTGPITFQWRRGGTDIQGATLSSFEDASADPGIYSVRVTGPGGSIVKEVVTVSPNFALNLVPFGGGTITATPPGAYQPPGTVVTLRATPDNGYVFSSWNGALTGSANPTTLVMNDHKNVEAIFRPTGGTVYFVNRNLGQGLDARVFDTDGTTPAAGPGIVAQLYAGAAVETLSPIGPSVALLTGDAAGYFRGEDRSIPAISPGSAAWVQIRAWDSSKGATYEAARDAGGKHGANTPISILTGNAGNPPSVPTVPRAWTNFKLQIGAKPSIVTQPQPVVTGLGSVAKFEVVPAGPPPLSFQWKKNNVDIQGARSAIYEIPSVNASHVGDYSVRISNAHGFVDSDTASLVIAPVPVITEVLINPATPLLGRTMRLEVVVQGTGPITYQWRRSGTDIQGANLSSFEDASADPGIYSVRVIGPGGSIVKEVVTVSPNYALNLVPFGGGTITATPPGAYQPPGTVVTLRATPDNGYVFSSWNGALSGSANPTTLVMNDHKNVEAIFRPTGGTVYFVNRNLGQGLDARIFDTDGTTPAAGPGIVAQLYAGATLETLGPVGPPVSLLTEDAAGYFRGEDRSIATIAPGSPALVQIRAWDSTKGSSYEAARDAGGKYGTNAPISVLTGNAGNPPSVPTVPRAWTGLKLQIGAKPSIVTQPQPVVTGLGNVAKFEVVPAGPPPLSFQWKKNNVDIQGARSAIYEIASVNASHAGDYSVRVSNAYGFVDSDAASLVIVPVPVITEVLINPATPLFGRTMRLEVIVQGTGPITYQWRRGGTDIQGANLSSFEDAAADPGIYSVRVTGPGGSIVREVVTVSPNYALNLVPFGGGTITATPPGAYQPPGTVVTLRATPDNGYVFSSWNGALSGSANPTTLLMNDHKNVEAIFRPTGGTVYFVNRNLGQGLDARIFDTDGTTPASGPDIVAQLYAGATPETLGPVGPIIPLLTDDAAGYFRGEDRSIASIAPGSPAWVQIRAWDTAKGASFEAARDANGRHGANTPVSVITGNAGNPPSVPTVPRAWSSFKLQIGASPQIVSHPKPVRIGIGGTAKFEVQATGAEPLTYRWSKGTTLIQGATTPVLEIKNVAETDAGSYSVRVSNAHGHADSNPAALSLVNVYSLTLALSGAGQIITDPAASEGFGEGVYLPGTQVSLQAIPDAGAVFSRWEGGITGSVNPTTITMTSHKSVTAVFEGTGNGGTVDFRNFGGGIDAPIFDTDGTTRLSGPAFLAQLYAGPSESTLQPIGAAVPFRTDAGAGYLDNRGGSLRVIPTVPPGGTAFIQIRAWESAKGLTFEAALDAAGKTGSSIILAVTTGGGLSTPTLPIGLTSFRLNLPAPPSVRTPPMPVVIGLGGKARFEVVADGSEPITYQWLHGTTEIRGATTRIYEIGSVQSSDAGEYSVRITNPFGRITTTPVPLTIVPLPAIASLIASPNPGLVGKPLRLEVVMTGAEPFTYQWRLNDADLPGANQPLYEQAAAQAGTYSVRITGVGGTITENVLTVSSQFLLDLIALRGGTAVANPALDSYPRGTLVTLTATPEVGYGFGGWVGDASGNNPVTSVVMNDHRRVEALFIPLGGTVYFVNRNVGLGIDAPVFDEDGTTRLSGAGFVAQLYAGPIPTALAPIGRPLSFLDGAGAGYFRGEDRAISTVPPGSVAYVQIRAWELAAGSTYEAAAAARGKHGNSATISVITGNVGSPPSLPAYLSGIGSFQLRRGVPPRIVTAPSAITVNEGQPAVFSVLAEGDPAPSYQWLKDGIEILGATSPGIEFTAAVAANAGPYSVRVFNSVGSVTSDPVSLTVIVPPTITLLTPNPSVILAGNTVELAALANGTAPIAYQWYAGVAGDTSTPVGVSGPSWTTPPLTVSTSYWVRASNAAGAANSPTLSITVNRRTQSITFAPIPPTTAGAEPLILQATATSSLPITFEIASGSALLAGNALTPNRAGTVVVRATQPGNEIYLPAPAVEQSVAVGKASAIVTLARLQQTFDGAPKRPDVSVSPPGLTVTVTFNGLPTAPSAAGRYEVQAIVDDANYSGSASGTLEIIAGVNLAGIVFDDANGNGTRDEGETGIAGVLLRLLDLDSVTELRTATTDSAGEFQFSGVATASYYLEERNPAGFISTTPDLRLVSLSPGTVSQVHFGDQAVATIAGVVFEDADADGTLDDSERPLPGVSIRLIGADGQRSTTTGQDGSYRFPNLNPGPYTVEETDLPGYFSTTPNVRNVSVAPGGAGSASFGDQAAGTVSGVVFEDRNGNGSPDEGESGIPNVSVRLTDTATQRTTRTDASGLYRFGDVQPGSYTVEEIDPLGFTSTTPNLRSITLGNAGSANAHFGDQPEATVGGVVFNDLDGNGLQDSTEAGIAGVLVRLIGATGQRSTSTASDGSYLFANVQPGAYTVEETDPVGYTSSTPNTRAASVSSGGAAIASFGDQVLASISGVVFEDLNGNGSYDDGEPGVGGVEVFLVRTGDQANVGETTTASSGAFLFANIPPGSYEVRQLLPSGYTVLTRNTVPPSPARHAASPSDSVAKAVSLAEGGAGSASFGINVVRTLSGMIFNDLDGNGLPAAGEPGIGGILVEVRNLQTDVVVATTSTAADGLFVVPGLATGSYSVEHAPIPGFLSPNTPASVTVSATTAAAANFPVRASATASGRVFNDENGDGVRGPAEPGIGGARVTLQRTGSASKRETQTATDGSFLVTGLETGDWQISLSPLPGFTPTTPTSVSVSRSQQASINASFGVQSDQFRVPSISREPADLTLASGTQGSLVAEATGSPTLEFQWLKNGTPIPGATSLTLSFPSAGQSDAATYQLRVRNAYGTALSRETRVTVTGTAADPYAAWAASENIPQALRQPNQDADGDGLMNILEFLLGTSPIVPNPDAQPEPVLVSRNGASFLGFELRVRNTASVQMSLESSLDLVRWTEVSSQRESLGSDADGERIRIFDSVPLTGAPFRFIRLGVALSATPAGPATLRVVSASPVATSFHLTVEGEPGRRYAVEGSDDLIRWTLLQEVVATATPLNLSDDTLGGARYRFYRAVPR